MVCGIVPGFCKSGHKWPTPQFPHNLMNSQQHHSAFQSRHHPSRPSSITLHRKTFISKLKCNNWEVSILNKFKLGANFVKETGREVILWGQRFKTGCLVWLQRGPSFATKGTQWIEILPLQSPPTILDQPYWIWDCMSEMYSFHRPIVKDNLSAREKLRLKDW